MSCAAVSADDNSTSDDNDTLDEEIDLDVTYDDTVDNETDTGDDGVVVSLQEHATANPIVMALLAVSLIFIPLKGRN